MKSLISFAALALLSNQVTANCGIYDPCTTGCCASPECPSEPDFFCSYNTNPFRLHCVNGLCQQPTACAPLTCFETTLNSFTAKAPDMMYFLAVTNPNFPAALHITSSGISFTNQFIEVNGQNTSIAPHDTYIQMQSTSPSSSTAQLVLGNWQTTAPLLNAGNTFLAAASVPIPQGQNWANANIRWCGIIHAPAAVNIQVSAALYSTCDMDTAAPVAADVSVVGKPGYLAGAPQNCVKNLLPGGTGLGGIDYTGLNSCQHFSACL